MWSEIKTFLWIFFFTELLSIIIGVKCKNQRIKGLILKNRGSYIAQIAKEAEQTLRNVFRTEVKLRLNVYIDETKKKKKKSYN